MKPPLIPMVAVSRLAAWERWAWEVEAGRDEWVKRQPQYEIRETHPGTRYPWAIVTRTYRLPVVSWWAHLFQNPGDVLEARAMASQWSVVLRTTDRQSARARLQAWLGGRMDFQ